MTVVIEKAPGEGAGGWGGAALGIGTIRSEDTDMESPG